MYVKSSIVSVASHDFLQPLICLHPSSSCRAPFCPFDVIRSTVAELLDIRFSASLCYAISVFATEQSACLCRVRDVLSFTFKLQLTIKLRDFFRLPQRCNWGLLRGELSYLAPLSSENISAPYFKQCFFWWGVSPPQTESNTTPPSPKTEITNILYYILNFASIIKFKM